MFNLVVGGIILISGFAFLILVFVCVSSSRFGKQLRLENAKNEKQIPVTSLPMNQRQGTKSFPKRFLD